MADAVVVVFLAAYFLAGLSLLIVAWPVRGWWRAVEIVLAWPVFLLEP